LSAAVLEIQGLVTELTDARGSARVLDRVDLRIGSGSTLALVGESGCGKSMTALSIMRLLPPAARITSGRVDLHGEDLVAMPEWKMRGIRGGRIGMVFQEPMTALNPVLPVGRQIAEAVALHQGLGGRDLESRVIELLSIVGMPSPQSRLNEFPHQMSGGMKQRVVIAMALAGDPELLIADEPTTALDVTIQAQVLSLIRDLQARTGMAVLLITHDLGIVAEMADRVAVMYSGQIVEQAGIREFFRLPRHPYSRKLFESAPSRVKRGGRLAVIPGFVPNPHDRPPTCHYLDRCHIAAPACRESEPPWVGARGGDGVRCLRAREPDQPASVSPGGKSSVAPLTAPEEPLLLIRDLKVHFPIMGGLFRRTRGWVRAVDGIDLEIPKGRTLALVGESGCGKTTVGKAILQLAPATGGCILVRGVDLTGLSRRRLRPYRSRVQIVFQDPAGSLNPRMLVEDIVSEGLVAQGVVTNRLDRRERARALLEQVGMAAEAADRYPHEFSGGQRQRICIARALAVGPEIIVCDEPTSALDVSVQAQILNLLKEIQVSQGISYLFITHDLGVVSYLADEIAVMYLGRIVERGATLDVMDRPAHPYSRALLDAVPVAVPGERKAVLRLEGDPPSPASPPPGCHFHPRCPKAESRCRSDPPPLRPNAEGRLVRCFYPLD